jgi:hypothetical protein
VNYYSYSKIIFHDYAFVSILWHVAHMGEGRKVYRVLMGKLKGKRTLERLRHRWEDGIRIDLGKIGWVCACARVCVCMCGVDSIGSG